MTFSDRTAVVASLGFTSRQATFLTFVALHSGYCLRRQYTAFTGQQHGKNVRDFFHRLVDRGLATTVTFRPNRGSIYHLFSRRLYAALGQEDNRNRRNASPALVARKLMLLDFVLEHPDREWYATEIDKIDLFVNRLRVPESLLPQPTYSSTMHHGSPAVDTTRYWIQKLPIFLSGTPTSINFVAVVTDRHASAVETFVREHAALLRHMETWTLHAITPRNVATESSCRAAYQRALAAASLTALSKEDLDWFRSTRDQVLRGDLRDLAVGDLRRYRDLNSQVGHRLDTSRAGPLVFHVLPYSYSQFGSLPGVA